MSGFFGHALGAIGGLLGQNAEGKAGGIMGSVLSEAGGVQGLLDRADQAGLGDHVRSWIGNGENWPISPAEIERIFPPEQLDAWAAQHGLPQGTVSEVLSHLLPHAVDQATPGGTPAGNGDAGGGGGDDRG